VLRLGAVVVPIDRVSTRDFSSRVTHQMKAKLVVYSEGVQANGLDLPSLAIESIPAAIARHSDSNYASPQISRQDILEIVFTSGTTAEPRGVVITHGTDTMVETGLVLKKNLTELTAPIIMTGAMTPLGFEGSDGLQNLTESLLAARILGPGVWLVMHNQVFPIDGVRKDKTHARFVSA